MASYIGVIFSLSLDSKLHPYLINIDNIFLSLLEQAKCAKDLNVL